MTMSNSFLEKSVFEYKNGSSINKVRTAIIGIISSDPAFNRSKYDDAINYVKNNGISLSILFEKLDENNVPKINNNKEEWDKAYFAKASINCERNFCLERINHLREVGRNVYKSASNNIVNSKICRKYESSKKELNSKMREDGIKVGEKKNKDTCQRVGIIAIVLLIIVVIAILKSRGE